MATDPTLPAHGGGGGLGFRVPDLPVSLIFNEGIYLKYPLNYTKIPSVSLREFQVYSVIHGV